MTRKTIIAQAAAAIAAAPQIQPAGTPRREGDWRIYPNGVKVFDPIPQLPPVNPYATFNRG